MTTQNLNATIRELTGRKTKRLRRDKLLPGNIFGRKLTSQAVTVNADEFRDVFALAGETGIIELQIDKEKKPVLVSNVALDPVTDEVIHVDFRQVDLKEKITATVPVEVVGESPAAKSGIGTLVQQINEIDVSALPSDFPESFIVDASTLTEVDQAIYARDLQYDATKLELDIEPDSILVKVEPPQKVEEVVVEAPVAEGEVPATEAGETPVTEETPAQTEE